MAQDPPSYRVASADDRTGTDDDPAWTNRLIDETSPYLLQHAHNPVDWYPWGDEAFEQARAGDKPILLSIGYAACHWCHVMEHESFSDPDIAAWLNERFVPIKVDREERPDIDAIYIQALSALQGQAGWPANLFLLPDLRPFAGATYLPPRPRYGMPSFQQVLERVHRFWTDQRDKLEATGAQLTDALGRTLPPADRGPDLAGYRRAVRQVVASQDPEHGGHGQGQKFPQTPTLELLLLGAADGVEGARTALGQGLLAMASGGLYDHLGGGFHRYCVDRAWTVPHFEKMLYDNAQLLRLYARAARLLDEGHPALARRCVRVVRETVHYLHHDLRGEQGAFWSSEDADDPKGEGFFYTFTPDEAREALGDEGPLPYGIREGGNFEHGRTVLSTWDGRPPEPVRQRLLAFRDRRERPATDTKRVVAWNGLALGALAEAGRLLGFEGWIDEAARCAELLLAARRDDGTWPRLLDGGAPGTLEDHADLADGLLDLFQARPHALRWLDAARDVAETALAAFGDDDGGALYQSADRPDLVVRRRDFQDGAEPSGNGRMASVLARLLAYGADLDRATLDDLVRDASGVMDRAPLATPELWGVVRSQGDPPRELVIAGPPAHPTTLAMLRAWNRTWRPQGLVAVVSGDDDPGDRWSLLADRAPRDDGTPRAYLCRGGVCRLPVASAEALSEQLAEPTDPGAAGS